MYNTGTRIYGYASLFGVTDKLRDVVERGAFRSSLVKRDKYKMFWEHNLNEPIGFWSRAYEDDVGLFVEGYVAAIDKSTLIRRRIVDGLSIGFKTLCARTDWSKQTRHLLEIDLWEISIVKFPAATNTRVQIGAYDDHRSS